MRRMKLSIRSYVLIALFGMIAVAGSQLNASAQNAFTVIDIGGGVRALAMGESFIGLANDEQATYYNPAGLGFLDGIYGSANFERSLGVGSYLSLQGGTRNVGANLTLYSVGDIEQRDATGNVTGTFGYSNFALSASGGTALSALPLGFTQSLENFALGTRLKFVSVSSAEGGNGSAFAFDLAGLLNATSTLANLGLSSISLMQWGFTIENLLSLGVSYDSGRSERLPFKFKTGFGIKPIEQLSIALDFAVPFEFHVGGEYNLAVPDPLTGVDIRAGGSVRGGSFAFTAGFGIAREPMRLDYAFTSHATLPGSHRLALAVRF